MPSEDDFEGQEQDGLSREGRRRNVLLAWDEVDSDPNAASAGAVFEEVRRNVTEAIEADDLARAESLTAKAWLMCTGCI